jgi:23S rRNA (uracil1939-C5)-methyltransferase
MYEKDQIIKGTVSTLAYGGKGILRTQDQMVVFVPFTAPGDEITCRLTKVKKNYAEADLVEVLVPSLTRVTPKCPYFGTCGGCQLQHLSYDTQAEYKRMSPGCTLKSLSRCLSKHT